MNITNIAITDTEVTFTLSDGTTKVFPATTAPVVAPEATEIDLILTDGTTKKFVPAA